MNCPNCGNHSKVTLLTEVDGRPADKTARRCNMCDTVFLASGKILKEGLSLLNEVPTSGAALI